MKVSTDKRELLDLADEDVVLVARSFIETADQTNEKLVAKYIRNVSKVGNEEDNR